MATNYFQGLPLPKELRDALNSETSAEDGSGGVSSAPRTAKYVVGNAAAGDTIDVCDFLDPGNGTGIAAAIAAASVLSAGTSGDIFLRPGAYDFSAAGAPALPLALPLICTIRSAAAYAVPAGGGGFFFPSGALLQVGASRHLFGVGGFGFSICTFENIGIQLLDVPDGVGDQVIGGPGDIILDLCSVQFVLPEALQDVGLLALVRTINGNLVVRGGGGGQLFASLATLPIAAFYDAGTGYVDIENASVQGAVTAIAGGAGRVCGGTLRSMNGIALVSEPGIDSYYNIVGVTMVLDADGVGVSIEGDSRGVIADCEIHANGSGTAATGIVCEGQPAITGNKIQGCVVGIALSESSLLSTVASNSVAGAGAPGSIGIQVSGTDCMVSGNLVSSMETGVQLGAASAGVGVVANRLANCTTPIVDLGAGNLTIANLTT